MQIINLLTYTKTTLTIKILHDKLWYFYHKHLKLDIEVSLPQIIITKKHTKTAY